MGITLILLVGTFVIGRAAFGAQAKLEGYSFTVEAFERNNPAVLVRLCGMMLALFVAVVGSYRPQGVNLLTDLSSGIAAFVFGLVALVISRYVNDHVILHRIDNNDAVIKGQNVAVAIVEASTYLATAFIFAGGMMDSTHSALFNVVWFVIGQVFLVALARGYRALSPQMFTDAESGNPASALPVAGLLLSGGIAVGFAIRGEFVSWVSDLTQVVISLAIWLALMAVATIVRHITIIGKVRFNTELSHDRNWSVGLLGGLVYVAFTAAFVSIHG